MTCSQQRLVEPYPRFRQRAVESRRPLHRAVLEDDPGFDIDHHLHRPGCRRPGDEAALQAIVGDLMATPLDRARPLWDIYLIDGLGAGARCTSACTTASPTASRSRA